jgi:hypothetical protein
MNNQKFKVPIGTTRLITMLAIVSIWLASAISAWAYEVKICFIDKYDQPINGLIVKASDYTATTNNGCAVIDGLAENTYLLTLETPGYKAFSKEFSVGSNHNS